MFNQEDPLNWCELSIFCHLSFAPSWNIYMHYILRLQLVPNFSSWELCKTIYTNEKCAVVPLNQTIHRILLHWRSLFVTKNSRIRRQVWVLMGLGLLFLPVATTFNQEGGHFISSFMHHHLVEISRLIFYNALLLWGQCWVYYRSLSTP